MKKSVFIFVTYFYIHIYGNSARFEIDNGGYVMQSSLCNCIKLIAKTHFQNGTNVLIASANFQNITNKKLVINTNNLIMEEMMKETRWSITIKNGRRFTEDKKVF